MGDPETEAGEEEAERHEWKCGKEEVAATEGVDGIDGGDGEEEVDNSETQAGPESAQFGKTAIKEYLT